MFHVHIVTGKLYRAHIYMGANIARNGCECALMLINTTIISLVLADSQHSKAHVCIITKCSFNWMEYSSSETRAFKHFVFQFHLLIEETILRRNWKCLIVQTSNYWKLFSLNNRFFFYQNNCCCIFRYEKQY